MIDSQELFDIYFKDGSCRIWLYLEWDGDDLLLGNINQIPEEHWLSAELDQVGWDLVITHYPMSFHPLFFRHGIDWALRNGVGPWKPFLMYFDKPRWYKCSGPLDPDEWDVEYSFEIIYKPEYTLDDWQEIFDDWEHSFGGEPGSIPDFVTEFKVCDWLCDECLFTPSRIVREGRAEQIVEECLRNDTWFECHKFTIQGQHVCCRGFWNAHRKDVWPLRLAQLYQEHIKFVTPPSGEFQRD